MSQKRVFSKPLKKQTLAEQVAEAVKESILNGDWQAGDSLPTEPELAEQFGVSRAVIRDATRMLAARGLVESQHGRGVFVTDSPLEAFGDALLLALRRQSATVWDVEQFELLLMPEICVLVGQQASDEELAHLEQLVEEYLALFAEILAEHWGEESLPEEENGRLRAQSRALYQALAKASHNKLVELLMQPLVTLRNLRSWQLPDQTLENAVEMESLYFHHLLDAITSRDPEKTREQVRQMMQLPPEAEEAMRQTAVGEIARIVLAS